MAMNLKAGKNIVDSTGGAVTEGDVISTTTGGIVYAKIKAGEGVGWNVRYAKSGTESGIICKSAERPIGHTTGCATLDFSGTATTIKEYPFEASTVESGFCSGGIIPVAAIDGEGYAMLKVSEQTAGEWATSTGDVIVDAIIPGTADDGS